MIKKKEILPTLDPVAFAGALVLAPLLVALLFFWVLLIPVFAVVYGAIPYLVFGTPVLLWMVTRYPLDEEIYCFGGMFAMSVFAVCVVVVGKVGPYPMPFREAGSQFMTGIVFASTWFVAFAKLYGRFYRPARY